MWLNSETFFDLSGKAERLHALEAKQALPGFWADAEAARASVQEIKSLKNWLTPYDTLHHRLEEALSLLTGHLSPQKIWRPLARISFSASRK